MNKQKGQQVFGSWARMRNRHPRNHYYSTNISYRAEIVHKLSILDVVIWIAMGFCASTMGVSRERMLNYDKIMYDFLLYFNVEYKS